jgi:hypothetical protein
VIYSVWERSDSEETFYGCSDVSFDGGGGEIVGIGSDGAAVIATRGEPAGDAAPSEPAANGSEPDGEEATEPGAQTGAAGEVASAAGPGDGRPGRVPSTPPKHAQRAGRVELMEAARADGRPVDLVVRRLTTVTAIAEHVMAGAQAAGPDVWHPQLVVVPGGLDAVAAVDSQQR